MIYVVSAAMLTGCHLQVQSAPTAYQALLDLEKSKEPFSRQIVQAADIVKIDLSASEISLQLEGSKDNVERPLGFSGKEEWVLRWLLKKLEAHDTSARLDPRAWSFMGSLVGRIPGENAARILNGHGLLCTLRESLTAGLAEARAAGGGHTSLPGAGQDKAHDTSDGSKSSSTAVGDPANRSTKQSRKRKRSGSLVENDSPTVAPDHTGQAIGNLFGSMVSLLNRLVSMSKTPSSEESDLAGQYMTAVLRTDPDGAASLLSTALRATEYLVLGEKFQIQGPFTVGSSPLAPFVGVWEYRSVSTDDLSGRASNVSLQNQVKCSYLQPGRRPSRHIAWSRLCFYYQLVASVGTSILRSSPLLLSSNSFLDVTLYSLHGVVSLPPKSKEVPGPL